MSFNSNHINPIITLDNYEEYFILYMDNELDQNQVQMVESFLQQHPHLQAELDLLMETKLPAEAISFDKSSLLSANIQGNHAEEDLLLYIDNELDEQKKKLVQFELDANSKYQEQYRLLLSAKLDASEAVPHPDKTELYKYERRVIAFSLWMRIAAAFILIAAMSVLFFMSKNNDTLPPGSVAVQPNKTQPAIKENKIIVEEPISPQNEMAVTEPNDASENNTRNAPLETEPSFAKAINGEKNNRKAEQQLAVKPVEDVYADPFAETNHTAMRTASIEIPKQSFNNKVVTIDRADPYNNITAPIQSAVYVEDVVNNGNKKGSLKTFLRKATRFVEKTTGIDPANGEDELLIGAVALKL